MTFRFTPLLLAFLLAAGPLLAQNTPAIALPALLAAASPAGVPDTAAAIHRLFAAKRKKLLFILLGTVTAEVAGQAVIGATVHGGTGVINERDADHFLAALVAVPVVIAEGLFYAQYNRKHEQQALAEQQAHQLPKHLRRQLKARYFR